MVGQLVAVLVALLLMPPTGWGAQELGAQLERNPIRENETVRLILSAEGRPGGPAPDLSPLDADFEVLSTSTSTHVEFSGGRQSATTRWLVEIAPRRAGMLSVPPIRVGNLESPPIALQVLPAGTSGPGGGAPDIFLEVDAEPERPLVQSQVRYRVRLFRAVDILDGASLSEPESESAMVDRLGTDLSYIATRLGRRYRVLERRYALFPQASGTLELAPVVFVGEVLDAQEETTGFDRLFARGRRVRLEGEAVTLEVRPRPDDAPGDLWLPASELGLEEVWPEGAGEHRVGEPLTRTLRVRARGLRGDQLPELEMPVGEGLRSYPDQPVSRTSSDRDWVRGEVERKVALIPMRAGELILPEIRIPWWDVEADAPAFAVIPARTLTVAPATVSAAATAAASAGAPAVPGPVGQEAAPVATVRRWQTLSAALAVLWLGTVVVMSRRRPAGTASSTEHSPGPDPERARRALLEACRGSEARAARDALLDWAGIAFPEHVPRSLGELGIRLEDPALAREIEVLDRTLYAREAPAWQGEALARVVPKRLEDPSARDARQHAPLPPLYPASR